MQLKYDAISTVLELTAEEEKELREKYGDDYLTALDAAGSDEDIGSEIENEIVLDNEDENEDENEEEEEVQEDAVDSDAGDSDNEDDGEF